MAKKIKFKKQPKAKTKVQGIIGEGEEEGIDQTGTPVPIKLPPNQG